MILTQETGQSAEEIQSMLRLFSFSFLSLYVYVGMCIMLGYRYSLTLEIDKGMCLCMLRSNKLLVKVVNQMYLLASIPFRNPIIITGKKF